MAPRNKIFANSITKQLKTRAYRSLRPEILRAFERAKKAIIDEMASHPVSQELRSKTTSAYLTNGNLFGFLGFEAGTDPVGDLIKAMKESINIIAPPISSVSSTFLQIKILLPNKAEFRQVLPSRWESGISWVEQIEEGLDNYEQFLPQEGFGESELGIQTEKSVNKGDFGGTPYFTEAVSALRRDLLAQLRLIGIKR